MTFAAGETTKTVTLTIVGDTVNVVYRLERNTWGSSENLRMNVVDLQK